MKKYSFLLILLLGIAIRLIALDNPLLDAHHWRQTETEAVAYNFFHNGFNILFPEVRWYGSGPNYLCSEFQLYPFIVSLLWTVTGVHSIIGRILSVFFFIVSSIYLYRLSKDYFDENTALCVLSCFLIIPVNIYFSRTFQPESLLIFLIISSIWYYLRWLEHGLFRYLLLFETAFICALLVKITAFHVGFVFFYLLLFKSKPHRKKDWRLYLSLPLVLGLPILWYYHAHLIGQKYHQVWVDVWSVIFNAKGPTRQGYGDILISWEFYRILFSYRLFEGIFARAGGFLIFTIGIIGLWKQKKYRWIFIWLFSVFSYFPFVCKHLLCHEYYVMPMGPVVSIFMGAGIMTFIRKTRLIKKTIIKVSLYTLIIVVLLTIPFNSYRIIEDLYLLNYPVIVLGEYIKHYIPQNALIITCIGGGPTLLNIGNRWGWFIGNYKSVSVQALENLRKKDSAEYFICNRWYKLDKETIRYLSKHNIILKTHLHMIIQFKHEDAA